MKKTEFDAIDSERREASESGYAAIKNMLERLSLGDPDVRVLPDDIGHFAELGSLLNRVADFIREQVDESHEVAIGLCEHYETLLKLAGGDLERRASTASPVELIAKLGELINRQSETFLKVIRQQQAQEHELKTLNRKLQSIIDFLPDATFVIDAEHRVIAWNRAIEEMTGVTKEQILGEGDYAYTVPFYGTRRPALIDFIGNEEAILSYNYKYFKQAGGAIIAEADIPANDNFAERNIWITAAPLYDSNGERVGAIESIRDITDYKRIEEEKELLKEQLHHTQKLDSIGHLAGGIAHEFNNILAAILGYAGILEMRLGADSPHLTAVSRIINASEQAASLTRSMLAFSRKQLIELGPVPVNSFINGMEEMLCRLAGENVDIMFNLNAHELIVNADQGQLQQLILNLYNNARDAMPDGGSMTVSTASRQIYGREEDAPAGIIPGRYMQLTVADTGHGISPDVIDQIFDPFFTTKEVGKGTGLGLSMVFGIVQQHNGYIRVVSEVGKGTAFSIWLPEYGGGAGVEAVREDSVVALPDQGIETILVGEDNEDVRPMIVELMREAGYQVLEACNGAEVVSLMEDFGDTVDLLLLDVIMPRMNGFEALLMVRDRYPHLPCLFLSGYSDDILKQKAKISGEFEYLSKPIMPDKLLAAVRATLDGRKL